MLLAFIVFVIAGVSDAIDGFLAKRFDMATELGAYLDPLADKALLVSIYVTLAMLGKMPAWLTIVVVSRDIMIVGAIVLSWVLGKPVTIRPLRVSKLNTAAQIVLAALVLGSLGLRPGARLGGNLGDVHHRRLDDRLGRCLSPGMDAPHGELTAGRLAAGEPKVGGQGADRPMTLQKQVLFWLGALVAVIVVLWLLRGMLLPFVAGMALAYFLDPVADRLERLGLGRLPATLLIVGVFLLILVLLIILVGPLLTSQLAAFIERVPSLVMSLQRLFTDENRAWLAPILGDRLPDIQRSLSAAGQPGRELAGPGAAGRCGRAARRWCRCCRCWS